METRRWRWVLAVAAPVTGLLFGLAFAGVRWGRGWALLATYVLPFVALLGGLLLRIAVRLKLESAAGRP